MTPPQKPSAAGSWRWPAIIVGLLGGHVLLMGFTVILATRDRSFVVLPNSYQRALEWDKTRQAVDESARLGWKLTITPSAQVDLLGRRNVQLALVDAQGAAVGAADVVMSFYHRSHGRQRQETRLTTDAQGRAAVELPMRYDGFWEFDVTVRSGDRTFISQQTLFISTDARRSS